MGEIAQAAQEGQRRRDEIAPADEGRADRETLPPDVPHIVALIEFDEAALFQRGQQPVRGRRRKAGADGQIGEPIAFLVFAQRLEQRHGAVDRLNRAAFGAVLVLDRLQARLGRTTLEAGFHETIPGCPEFVRSRMPLCNGRRRRALLPPAGEGGLCASKGRMRASKLGAAPSKLGATEMRTCMPKGPHPALRATFSRKAGEGNDAPQFRPSVPRSLDRSSASAVTGPCSAVRSAGVTLS